MLKRFGRGAVMVSYLLITFEMVFMITPFALYYYAIYSPLLGRLSDVGGASWLPAFFLPHLSSDLLTGTGSVMFLAGLAGFLFNAWEVYYGKFKGRGFLQKRFYRHIRHPQYLGLALAGLGLVMIWPRFVLLAAYLTMLFLYYFLARDEERRMRTSYGEIYGQYQKRTAMFLPGEPGGLLARYFFNWPVRPGLRLIALYFVSLAAAVGAAFLLQALSLDLTPTYSLPDRKILAVSLLSDRASRLGELLETALASAEVQRELREGPLDDWVLAHAVEGEGRRNHLLIDAGMTRRDSRNLSLSKEGLKLIFSRRRDSDREGHPFGASARWRPAFVVEMEREGRLRVIKLEPALFPANPVMPIF